MANSANIVLETAEERLWVGETPVQLQPTGFRLLLLFIKQEGKLVTKRDILRHVWPDTNVSDASVKDCVKNLRATLGDDAAKPTYIETVRGRGYRFLGGIELTSRVVSGAEVNAEGASRQTVAPQPVAPAATVGIAQTPSPRTTGWQPALAVAILATGIAFGLSYIWRQDEAPIQARPEKIAFPIPEKPSIAVQPFVNLVGDPGIDWLSAGLSSNVISELSVSPDMMVISQNALDHMSGMKPGEVAEYYGVRYVLDGTFQGDGNKLRVSARLTDAIEGRVLWSGKWDRSLDDIFAIQDEIADVIFEELQVRLTIGEQARAWRTYAATPENMRAAFQGRGAFQQFTPESHEVAARLWNGIYSRNPELPMAMTLQGWLHWHKVIVGISTDPMADLLAAQEWAQKAIDAGLGGQPHVLYATAANYLGQPEKAVEYAEQGILASPGEADVVQIAGFVYTVNGRLEEGIALMSRGMRLEPDYPDWVAGSMTDALVKARRWAEARELALDVVDSDVRDDNAKFSALISLVVVSAWEQKTDEARQYMNKLLALRPSLTLEEMRSNPRYHSFVTLWGNPDYGERYLSALTASGLPVEK